MIMQSSALIVRNWLYNFYINLWTNVVNVKKNEFHCAVADYYD